MNRLPRALLSVAVGVVVFFGVTIAVAEGLTPCIWLSLMIGVPIGGVVGVAVVLLWNPRCASSPTFGVGVGTAVD